MSISQYIENLIAKLDLPIVTLEARRMLRGKWSFKTALIAVSIGSVLLVTILLLWIADNQTNMLTRFDPEIFSNIIAALLIITKLIILFAVYPVFSSRIIAESRESGAFPMLAITPMKSQNIIMQYFSIGFAHVILVTLLSVPIVVPSIISFMQNGSMSYMSSITPDSIIFNIFVYPIIGALYIAIGLLCSCSCMKATSATTVGSISMVIITWILYEVHYRVFSLAPDVYNGLLRPSIAQSMPLLLTMTLSIGITALLVWITTLRFEYLRGSM